LNLILFHKGKIIIFKEIEYIVKRGGHSKCK